MKKKKVARTEKFDWVKFQEKMAKLSDALDAKVDQVKLAAILAERAEQLANEDIVGTVEQVENNLDLLIFELGHEQYAIHTEYVLEVIPLKQLTRVPGVPNFILGVVSRRGQILSVIDICKFMGLAKDQTSNVLLFLECDGQQIGIAVHKLKEISQISKDSIQPLQTQLSGEQAHYISGVTQQGLAVLSVSELLSSKKLNLDS